MTEVSYYPGCSLMGTARDYEESIEAAADLLGIDLVELPDWNCCGATSGHSLSHRIALNLGARNLGLSLGRPQPVVVPCALCYNRLKTAQAELIEDQSLVTKEIAKLGTDYEKVDIVELNTYLTGEEMIIRAREKRVVELKGLKPVCYYGCQGQRPPKITGHPSPENPMGLDNLMSALGAEVRDWSFKTDCCGASHSIARPDILHKMVGDLYRRAIEAGANCFVTGCQMCQANLDLYQAEIAAGMGREIYLPVFYFTELIGLALGHKKAPQWFRRHMTSPAALLAGLNLL